MVVPVNNYKHERILLCLLDRAASRFRSKISCEMSRLSIRHTGLATSDGFAADSRLAQLTNFTFCEEITSAARQLPSGLSVYKSFYRSFSQIASKSWRRPLRRRRWQLKRRPRGSSRRFRGIETQLGSDPPGPADPRATSFWRSFPRWCDAATSASSPQLPPRIISDFYVILQL